MTGGGSEMALAEWIEARLVDVDPALATRVRDAVGDVGAATVRDAPNALLRAATARLAPLATGGCVERESAIELLAVDTLVTLACEALADVCEGPGGIVDRSSAMVRDIAATMSGAGGAT